MKKSLVLSILLVLCLVNTVYAFPPTPPTVNITGNAATATALAADPANCGAGQAPLGITASGAAEGCWTPQAAFHSSGLAAALPATCTAGDSYFATNTQALYNCNAANTWAIVYAAGSDGSYWITLLPNTGAFSPTAGTYGFTFSASLPRFIVNGALQVPVIYDVTGTGNIDTSGSITGGLKVVTKSDEGANTITASQARGHLILLGHADAISDLTLPDYQAAADVDHVKIGDYVCVMAASAYAHTIHPAADDKIRTSNLTLNGAGAGVTYTTASTPIGGFVCFVLSDAASDVGHWTQFGLNGTWPIH